MALIFNGGQLLFSGGQLAMSTNCCCNVCCPCDAMRNAWSNGKCLDATITVGGSPYTAKLSQISEPLQCAFWRGYAEADGACASGTIKIDIICIDDASQYPGFAKGDVIASIASGFGWPHIGCSIADEAAKLPESISCTEPGDFSGSWEWVMHDAPTCICGDGSIVSLTVTEGTC